MIVRSALFPSGKNIDHTQRVVFQKEGKNRCFKQIESNSIRFINNNFDAKVFFVNTLLLSHINSCQKSRVRGHTKVLEP